MGVKAAVIGIGNLLLKDEGVGVHAVNALRERHTFPEGVTLIDGGTMGLDLLPFIEGTGCLVLIDAVDFGKAPGYIQVIEEDSMKPYLDLKFSVHQIGIPDMLFAMEFKGIRPPRMCLVGIQPARIEAGAGLSDVIGARFEALLGVIIEKMRAWDIGPTGEACATIRSKEYGNVFGDTL